MPVPLHDSHSLSFLKDWKLSRRLKRIKRSNTIAYDTLMYVAGAANGYIWQPVSHAFTGDNWKGNATAVGALYVYYAGVTRGARAVVLALDEPGADFKDGLALADLERRARARLGELSAADLSVELAFLAEVFKASAGQVVEEARAILAQDEDLSALLYKCGHDDFLTKLGGYDRLPQELMVVLVQAAISR